MVNAGNQLTADANHSYQYDDNGNLTRKTLLATGNYSQYTYDAENRLTKVEDFSAGTPTAFATATYRYDGLGRRIEKVANGQTKRYVYDGEDILLEYDGANVLQARYTHGPGIDEPIAITKAGSTYFYHQDGLGTVTELTDASGAVAKAYAYDTHGNIVEQTGTIETPYAYTGRELDSETGLYYYRSRYYDPRMGRFLQKDSIGLYGGINLYAYVYNNVATLKDPSGRKPNDACYNCEEEALLAAFDRACALGMQRQEYGGTIYRAPSGKYGYTFNEGRKSNLQGSVGEVEIPPAPTGSEPVGVFHSHRYSRKFSRPDIDFEGDITPSIDNFLFSPDCDQGIVQWDFNQLKEVDLAMRDLRKKAKVCRKQ